MDFNYFNLIKKDIFNVARGVYPDTVDDGLFARFSVEPPKDASFGDVATNIAMILAGVLHAKPRDIAAKLAEGIKNLPDVEKVDVAGAGFINITMKNAFWYAMLRTILQNGTAYGNSEIGGSRRVNIEFVSANPTGPMHVGHSRGAVFGDALASLMQKAGYDVSREYYINDAGAQVFKLARSVYLRYKEALGIDIGEIPEGCYPGDYLIPVGKAIAEKDGKKWLDKPESEWLVYFKEFAVNSMMNLIRSDLELLGIHFDTFFSENELQKSQAVKKVVELLDQKGLLYRGVLQPPKGKIVEDYEPKEQLLFKSTEFGDDIDRPLQKSDGSYTYFTPDIAYHLTKFKRGFTWMIDVFGADHGGYVKRLNSAVKAVTDGKAELDVKLCQMINFKDNGEPVKMSKRSGTFITLKDVVDEVGKDVTRFLILTRKNDAHLDFDFTKVKETSKDNVVFYVQYAHARACSVNRNAIAMFRDKIDIAAADFSLLKDSDEIALIKLLSTWPRIVESAALATEPHRIAYFLNDVASAFHSLWNRGRDDANMKFLIENNRPLSAARLALVNAVAVVIASGLEVFGVKPIEEMR